MYVILTSSRPRMLIPSLDVKTRAMFYATDNSLAVADKPRDASASVTPSCNCEFAAISRYISETMQASAKVTTEREYEVIYMI